MAPGSGGIQFYHSYSLPRARPAMDAETAAAERLPLPPTCRRMVALGSVPTRQAKHVEAVEHYRESISLLPEYEAARDDLLCTMNYSEHWSDARSMTPMWNGAGVSRGRTDCRGVRAGRSHRIRVGYLSPDYREHPDRISSNPCCGITIEADRHLR